MGHLKGYPIWSNEKDGQGEKRSVLKPTHYFLKWYFYKRVCCQRCSQTIYPFKVRLSDAFLFTFFFNINIGMFTLIQCNALK